MTSTSSSGPGSRLVKATVRWDGRARAAGILSVIGGGLLAVGAIVQYWWFVHPVCAGSPALQPGQTATCATPASLLAFAELSFALAAAALVLGVLFFLRIERLGAIGAALLSVSIVATPSLFMGGFLLPGAIIGLVAGAIAVQSDHARMAVRTAPAGPAGSSTVLLCVRCGAPMILPASFCARCGLPNRPGFR